MTDLVGGTICPMCKTHLRQRPAHCPACGARLLGDDQDSVAADRSAASVMPIDEPAGSRSPAVDPVDPVEPPFVAADRSTLQWNPAMEPLATVGQRAGGAFIDALLFTPLFVFSAVTGPTHLEPRASASGRITYATVHDPRPFAIAMLLALPVAIYTVTMIAMRGRTLGEQAKGLLVVRSDGRSAGWGGSVRRYAIFAVISVISATFRPTYLVLALVVVYGWMLFDAKHQGLHDKLGDVIVVQTRTSRTHVG